MGEIQYPLRSNSKISLKKCGITLGIIVGIILLIVGGVSFYSEADWTLERQATYNTGSDSNNIYDFQLVGNIGYIGCSSGLQIVNFEDPLNPKLLANLNTSSSVEYIRVVNSIAFLTVREYGIILVNVSQPSSPKTLGTYEDSDLYYGRVEIHQDIAFVGNWTSGFFLLNISDPTHPQMIKAIKNYGSFLGCVVFGDILYAFHWQHGIDAFNLTYLLQFTESENPMENYLHRFDHYQDYDLISAWDFEYPYIYIAATNEGIIILDILNPTTFYEQGRLSPATVGNKRWYGAGITTINQTAYVGFGNDFVEIDAHKPTNMKVGHFYRDSLPSSYKCFCDAIIHVYSDYILIVSESHTIRIVNQLKIVPGPALTKGLPFFIIGLASILGTFMWATTIKKKLKKKKISGSAVVSSTTVTTTPTRVNQSSNTTSIPDVLNYCSYCGAKIAPYIQQSLTQKKRYCDHCGMALN